MDTSICLFCGFGITYPESPAGLCVSCQCDAIAGNLELIDLESIPRMGLTLPAHESTGTRLYYYDPIPQDPPQENRNFWYVDYPPPEATTERACGLREEFMRLTLSRRKPEYFPDKARRVIDAIRNLGLSIEIDLQTSRAVIDRPRALPHHLLCDFVEFQAYIEDMLSIERAEHIEADRIAYGSQETDRGDVSTGSDTIRHNAWMESLSHSHQ